VGDAGVRLTSRSFFDSSRRRRVIVTTAEELEEFAAETSSCWGGGLFCDRSHRAPDGRARRKEVSVDAMRFDEFMQRG
jgi:hypothetical protein